MPGSEMHKNEAVEMMNRAASEIEDLRRQIDRLLPKAEAYDRLCQVLDLLPKRSQAYGEDVARMLRKRIGELQVPAAVAAEASDAH